MNQDLSYLSGIGAHWETEALKGALPIGQNSPQKPPYGLYAEQLTGSAFTRARHQNLRSWLYRIQPSVVQGAFQPQAHSHIDSNAEFPALSPNQLRWDPLPFPKKPTDFIEGLQPFLKNGCPLSQQGGLILLYAANHNSPSTYFYSADGEWMIVPQTGSLLLKTEFGRLTVSPEEIAVIPRGVKFQVELIDKEVRGYICENHGEPFQLPALGPIGANGLANPRDFKVPTAHFEEKKGAFQLLCKLNHKLFVAELNHSPLNVVAWHGNYAPYKYNLNHFNTINTVSFDHPDPSIFTVLTSPSDSPGVANMDFVIFPERWMVGENTFRPPYYHRNIMSEYMGLIKGVYDAKSDEFAPGGGSLHNIMSAHGPDAASFEAATNASLKAEKQIGTLAFMFESRYPWHPSRFALQGEILQKDYHDCWQGLKSHFKR
ncbi:MAG: homogentisate 1,2-dioxygenase [Gammaproteobacteria bacterium]